MTVIPVSVAPRGFGQTARRDAWWATPAAVFTVLSAFIVYATWAAFQGQHYTYGPYLSPFYSPELFGDSPHAWFGPKPGAWPAWLPFSPALLILPFPGIFRLTCYYYRGAYYKAFWADPPSCAVGEPRSRYRGEHAFPLIVQNVHRYFLYVAVVFLALLLSDVWHALWFPDPGTEPRLVRHRRRARSSSPRTWCFSADTHSAATRCVTWWAAGSIEISRRPVRATAYRCATCLNRRHMLFAWLSLFSVALV